MLCFEIYPCFIIWTVLSHCSVESDYRRFSLEAYFGMSCFFETGSHYVSLAALELYVDLGSRKLSEALLHLPPLKHGELKVYVTMLILNRRQSLWNSSYSHGDNTISQSLRVVHSAGLETHLVPNPPNRE